MRWRFFALLAGFLLDLLLGDPAWLYHPVRAIGRYISFAEARLRARGGNLRRAGVLLAASTVLLSAGAAALAVRAAGFFGGAARFAAEALLCWMGLAQRSLSTEARDVARALSHSLEDGRAQVSRIVGRDTAALTREEVVLAAVETVAENATDGVTAPMLYMLLFGPAALWAFKAASTLDSMVGYKNERFRDIGWASARLDDALCFLPARLTGPLMCAAAALCGLDAREALRILKRDRRKHESPNSAHTEAACAGALRLKLGGPHTYFGETVDKPYIGDGRRAPEIADIGRARRLLHCTCALALALSAVAALIFG